MNKYKDCWCGHTFSDHGSLKNSPEGHWYDISTCKEEKCGCGQYDPEDDFNIIKYKKLNGYAKEPSKAYEGDACFDLYADNDFEIIGNETLKITTGIALEIPEGYEVVVRSRSSSFSKKNLWVHIGTIDYQYRGEVYFFVNQIAPHSHEMVTVGDGDWVESGKLFMNSTTIDIGEAIAQLAIREVPRFKFQEVDELEDSKRGSKGFGSSG